MVQSAAAGGIGEAGSRREATAMLTYDRLTKTAQASDAYKRRRAAAERAVAIRALGFKPEPEGAGYPEQYAGDTGELLSWAREKKSPAEIRAEVDQLLRETSPVKIMGRKKKSYASRH